MGKVLPNAMVAQMAELVRNGGWKLREPLGKRRMRFLCEVRNLEIYSSQVFRFVFEKF